MFVLYYHVAGLRGRIQRQLLVQVIVVNNRPVQVKIAVSRGQVDKEAQVSASLENFSYMLILND